MHFSIKYVNVKCNGGVYEAHVRKRVQDRNPRHIGDKLLAVEEVRGSAGADFIGRRNYYSPDSITEWLASKRSGKDSRASG